MRRAKDSSHTPTEVSVIIPAKNVADVIGSCLDSLVKQIDIPSEAFEVILVDNGSSDETIRIASRYRAKLDLRVLEKRNCYISAVRNHGAAVARGEILAFLDADCMASRTWLKEAMSLCSPDCLVGAFYDIPARSSWVARAWYGFEHQEKTGAVSYIPSGNLIIARRTFATIGGFNESIETNEDYELCQRAIAAKCQVVAFPSLTVVHLGTPQTLFDFAKKNHWHGKHVTAVTLRNVGSFRNAKAISFAAYTLVCIIGVISGGGVALLANRDLLLIAATIGLLAAPMILGLWSALRRGRWRDAIPLGTLFLIYGFARSFCLLNVQALVSQGVNRARSQPRTVLR
jgi:glycosyltransferase involved in cell wall biosynthesis